MKPDFSKIRTYPIKERQNKFTIDQMIPLDFELSIEDQSLERVAEAIHQTQKFKGKVVFMMGGAVIKVGCSAMIIDMMKRGYIHHIAVNGSVSIHDFEIALIGATSEDVEEGLIDGQFGMAEETGRYLNEAAIEGYKQGMGYGQAVGKKIADLDLPYKDQSVFYAAYQMNIPITVHVAIGGDIIHQHPTCDGAALGATSYEDFKRLTETVTELANGVVLNFGSAVVMPEAFLKALTIARNLGSDVKSFVVGNFDFIDMYRPRTRLLEWPARLGCYTYDFRMNHAESMPAIYRHLMDREK